MEVQNSIVAWIYGLTFGMVLELFGIWLIKLLIQSIFY
jgi:hypothetical protein